MYAKSLKPTDYEELIRQKDVKQVISSLKSRIDGMAEIDEHAERREIEKQLFFLLEKDIQRIIPLLDNKSKRIVNIFTKKYEIKYIKQILRDLLMGDKKESLVQLVEPTSIFRNLNKFNQARDRKEFIEIAKDTEYYKNLEQLLEEDKEMEDRLIFKVENVLDKMYFYNIYQLAKSENEKVLLDIVGKQIDLLNILWIYRAKTYHFFQEKEIKEYVIPIQYKLTEQQIEELIETQEYQVILQKTWYRQVFQDLENIEKKVENYLNKVYKSYFRKEQFNLSVVICYFELKEIEIRNMVNLIEGIRYSLSIENLKKKIII